MQKIIIGFALLFSSFNSFGLAITSRPLEENLNLLASDEIEGDMCSSEDKLQKCAQDLCGAPKDVPSMILTNQNFEEFLSKGLDGDLKEFEKKLDGMLKETQKKNIATLEKFKKLNSDRPMMPDYEKWQNKDWKDSSQKLFSQYLTFEVDASLPVNKRFVPKYSLPENSGPDFESALKAYGEESRVSMLNDLSDALRRGVFTLPEGKKFIQERLGALEKFKDDDTFKAVQKQVAEKINTFKDLENAAFALTNFEEMLYMREHKGEVLGFANRIFPDCSSEGCRKGVKSATNELFNKRLIPDLEASVKDQERLNDYKMECLSNFVLNHHRSERTAEFRKMIPEIAKNFQDRSLTEFSDHSRKAFETYLKDHVEIEVEGPRAGKNLSGQLELIMNKKSDPMKGLNEIGFDGDFSAINPYQGIKECYDYYNYADEFTQASDLELAKVNVSIFTCTHHGHGKGVFAHELSHAVSIAFHNNLLSKGSYTSFMELRNCSKGLYLRDKRPAFTDFHSGDLYRTEEDTADLLMFKFLKDEDPLVYCSLLNQDGQNYLELDQHTMSDTHSAPFIRILREATHRKKKIPSSCQDVMKENEAYLDLKTCY